MVPSSAVSDTLIPSQINPALYPIEHIGIMEDISVTAAPMTLPASTLAAPVDTSNSESILLDAHDRPKVIDTTDTISVPGSDMYEQNATSHHIFPDSPVQTNPEWTSMISSAASKEVHLQKKVTRVQDVSAPHQRHLRSMGPLPKN